MGLLSYMGIVSIVSHSRSHSHTHSRSHSHTLTITHTHTHTHDHTHTHTHSYYSQDFVELLQWWSDRVGVAYNPNLNPHLPTFRVAFFPLLCLLGEVYNGYMDVQCMYIPVILDHYTQVL